MAGQSDLSVVILAAGKGTRMKSGIAKVLHPVFYAPMLHHVLAAVQPLPATQIIVVVGHQQEEVRRSVTAYDVLLVAQNQQNGTGHAVLCAKEVLNPACETVMILCGDTPLVQTDTLSEMYAFHCDHGGSLSVMTTELDEPKNYGRVLSKSNGTISAIVEEKDASPEQRLIKEINAGIYCAGKEFLFSALEKVGTANSQGEVYLTDIVSIATKNDIVVRKYRTSNSQEVLGVNSRVELAEAGRALQMRRNRELMLAGVTLLDPAATVVAPQVQIESDVLLYPGTRLEGDTKIERNCVLENGVILQDCKLEEGVRVGAYSCLTGFNLKKEEIIPPHTVGRKP